MKKILVPIDYSAYADNAVRYAMQLAKKINASIHLCHSLMVPELIPMAGLVVWPVEDYKKIKDEANRTLKRYVEQISKEPEFDTSDLHNITYASEMGSVRDVVNTMVADQKIDLVVMGTAGAGNVERFFLGSNSRDMVENTKVPLLLIPKQATFTALEKIALATDLSESDLHAVQTLTRLFCLFNPDLLLTHVNSGPSDFHDPTTKANRFLNRVTCNINYAKIYYRHLTAPDVDKGLQWIIEHGNINMLAMIHRQNDFLDRLISGSHTQKMVRLATLPLLVLPENKQPIGW